MSNRVSISLKIDLSSMTSHPSFDPGTPNENSHFEIFLQKIIVTIKKSTKSFEVKEKSN